MLIRILKAMSSYPTRSHKLYGTTKAVKPSPRLEQYCSKMLSTCDFSFAVPEVRRRGFPQWKLQCNDIHVRNRTL
jgi:hypothetical protein